MRIKTVVIIFGILFILLTGITGCAPDYLDPAPTDINFTLDLSSPENASLRSIGGSVSKDGVIVMRISSTEFSAVSQTCTYTPSVVNFQSSDFSLVCPKDQSKFNKDGVVIGGPATKPLRKYTVVSTPNTVTVTS